MPNVTPLTAAEAERHLDKAEQYLRAAATALEHGDHDAAGGNAVNAGINAADSLSGMIQGDRWSGPHEQATAHVRKVGADGRIVANQLAKLIRKKSQAQYEATPLRLNEAAALVQAAERAVEAARVVKQRRDARR
jgi:hypothetical protein